MNYNEIITQGTIAIGILVALTNIITEVAKLNIKSLRNNADVINMFATCVAIALTCVFGVAFAEIKHLMIEWYYIFALLIVGFMVALASMTNFDKLISYFENIKGDK